MGIAAYNRGTKVATAQLEIPDSDEYLLRDLNTLSRHEGKSTPFQAGVIRRGDDGHWWMMDSQEEGWASFAYQYESLRAIARDWRIRFIGRGKDDCSEFIAFEPR